MPQEIAKRVLNWATDIDGETLAQASRTATMPFIAGHVALMPDAHLGLGSTVGSVIPTEGAIMPAAIGVDIGCGMIAVETDITASQLPDDLSGLLSRIEERVPAGVGKGHSTKQDMKLNAPDWWTSEEERLAISQIGSLGSGNHFVEVCLDERDVVWVVLHSGSRGVGNRIATRFIKDAKGLMKKLFIQLPDPDLAYFSQSMPEFKAYIDAMHWAQDYALENRDTMMSAVMQELKAVTPAKEVRRINCHHNFTQIEHHNGRNIWVTRKGAIKAGVNDYGVIPGSMGTRSYIIKGKGNPASYESCSHGAGRKMSRSEAKRQFSIDDINKAMEGKVWLKDKAQALIDEIPSSYKDIDEVMENQKDLVEIQHTLRQVLNYKGT